MQVFQQCYRLIRTICNCLALLCHSIPARPPPPPPPTHPATTTLSISVESNPARLIQLERFQKEKKKSLRYTGACLASENFLAWSIRSYHCGLIYSVWNSKPVSFTCVIVLLRAVLSLTLLLVQNPFVFITFGHSLKNVFSTAIAPLLRYVTFLLSFSPQPSLAFLFFLSLSLPLSFSYR